MRLALAASLLSLLAAPAHAHHPFSEGALATVAPRPTTGIEVAAASFDRAGEAGSWQQLTGFVEVPLGARLAVGARWPLARVDWADGHSVSGGGDVEVGVRGLILRADHDRHILSAGLGVELPTGSEEELLGGGHFELTPSLTYDRGMLLPGGVLVLRGTLGGRFSLDSGDGGGPVAQHALPGEGELHGAVMAPHADRELFLVATVIYLRGPAWVSAGGEVVSSPGAASAGGAVGWSRGRLLVGAGLDATVAGEARFGVRGKLSVAFRF